MTAGAGPYAADPGELSEAQAAQLDQLLATRVFDWPEGLLHWCRGTGEPMTGQNLAAAIAGWITAGEPS